MGLLCCKFTDMTAKKKESEVELGYFNVKFVEVKINFEFFFVT